MSCALHPSQDDTFPCARCGAAYCGDCLVLLRSERLCAACKESELRDVVSGTHENVRLARLLARASAYVIDRALFYASLASVLRTMVWVRSQFYAAIPRWAVFVTIYVMSAAWLVYEGWMLASRGQTLGKMAAKVRVVRRDGTPISRTQGWNRAVIRTLFIIGWLIFNSSVPTRYSDWALVIFALGIVNPLIAAVTPQRTALHDLLARTRVYRAD